MKKTIYLITFLTILVSSCKKELRMSTETPSTALLDKTKQFYDKQTALLSAKANQLSSIDGATGSKSKIKAKFPPLWENAQTGATANGKHIISIPLAVYRLDAKDVNYTRKVVFTENGGEVTAGKITEVFASPETIAAHGDELANGQVSPESIGFTGSVVNYNLDYKEAKGKYYKNGVAAKGEVSISEKPAAISVKLQQTKDGSSTNKAKLSVISGNDRTISAIDPVFDDGENCDNVYEVYIEKDAYGNVTYWEMIRFLYKICLGGPVVGAPPGGRDVYVDCFKVVNGEAYNSDCGCIGGTTGVEVCVPRDITDSLDNFPCAKDLVLSLTTLKNDVAGLIKSTFASNSDINVRFVPHNFGSGSSTDGDFTLTKLQPKNGYNANAGYTIYSEIRLNEDVLLHGTKEYILVTMYHEAVHAFLAVEKQRLTSAEFAIKYPDIDPLFIYGPGGSFDLTKKIFIQDHSVMGNNFVNKLVQALKSYNVNLSDDTAKAMAVSGILAQSNSSRILNQNERDVRKNNFTGTKCP